MLVSGEITLRNVTGQLAQGLDLVRAGISGIDLAEVSALDSSLLAVLLAWIREARTIQRSLVVSNPPSGLITLAQLYGVQELLPLSTTR